MHVHRLAYVYIINEKTKEKFPTEYLNIWSELGEQNIQAKKVSNTLLHNLSLSCFVQKRLYRH